MRIFAHRGLNDRHVSENTLAAFVRAVEAGADGIEFDVRVSRDGIPIAIHDEHLDRVAGDARRVRDLTAKELQGVVLRGDGRIPTLNDITSAVPYPVMLDMEIKDRDVIEPLVAKLRTSTGLRERTIVSSFVADDLRCVMEFLPDVRTLLLHRGWPLPTRGRRHWADLESSGVWGVGFRAGALNPSRVRWLQRKGWKVAAWDEQPLKKEARKIQALGVDIAIVYRIKRPAA
jgi:glycerophosphoryl diester phosphodiesterase